MVQIKGPAIWIVEDDPSVQRIVSAALQHHGFAPVVFDNAEKAYGALHCQPYPSLIILDILLPGMSGVDLIRLLKQNKSWDKIPVVVMSVLTRENILKAGTTDDVTPAYWMSKPFETNDLVRTIQDILAAVRH